MRYKVGFIQVQANCEKGFKMVLKKFFILILSLLATNTMAGSMDSWDELEAHDRVKRSVNEHFFFLGRRKRYCLHSSQQLV